MEEVSKTTSYLGGRRADASGYDRLRVADEDAEALRRYWDECKGDAESALRPLVSGSADDGTSYTLTLDVAETWGREWHDGLCSALRSYFITSIISKWLALCGDEGAGGYGNSAATHLDTVRRGAWRKGAPVKPLHLDTED